MYCSIVCTAVSYVLQRCSYYSTLCALCIVVYWVLQCAKNESVPSIAVKYARQCVVHLDIESRQLFFSAVKSSYPVTVGLLHFVHLLNNLN